jgi:hypothetical protein
MKSKLFTTCLVALALVATPTFARTPVPIINYDNVAVASNSGRALTTEEVKQAIMAAAGAKNWSIAHQADGKLQAILNVRNKHTIVVEIAYAKEHYSLTYKDSTNMKFSQQDGHSVIHPFYNKWVQDFKDAIRRELLKA